MTDQELMQQSMMTAHDYMNHARRDIDELFGEGYAAKNPQLIGDYMKTAAIDLATFAGLRKISESIDGLTISLDLLRLER